MLSQAKSTKSFIPLSRGDSILPFSDFNKYAKMVNNKSRTKRMNSGMSPRAAINYNNYYTNSLIGSNSSI